MKKQVRVYGVHFEGHEVVPFVPDEQADCFAVAIGVPGDFNWVADFTTKAQAIEYGQQLAAKEGAKFVDASLLYVRPINQPRKPNEHQHHRR